MFFPLIRRSLVSALAVIAITVTAYAAERPNIVWLTTEDNSAHWYRLYHENGAAMPNIERLAENGLVFNNAYSNAPVCSTARSTIISGCYASRLGAQYHRAELHVAMPNGVKMFPWYLRQAGYYTTNNRKEDYNFANSEKANVWDDSSRQATYRNRQPGQPFFHIQNHTDTHESRLFLDHLPKEAERLRDPSSVEVFPYHPDTPLMREKYAQYLNLHSYVDSKMGKLVDQLAADGLLDDTFIFHYGDHGGVLPGSKGYARNDGLQVAMVVYVPKNWQHLVPAQRGSRIDGCVEFVDLSATVLNLAGVEIPSGIDGKPFLGPGVTLEELNRRDSSIGYAERFDEKYDMVRFLRKGKYTYHRSYQPFNFDGLHNYYRYKQPAFRQWRDMYQTGDLNDVQSAFFESRPAECLYDIEKDPHEVHNLAEDPTYAAVLNEMRTLLRQRLKSMPDVGFIPEPIFVADSGGKGVQYAQRNRTQISRLIDIADLQLLPFPTARPRIEKALASTEPLQRYWGLITCSAFGQQAAPFYRQAQQLATEDTNLLVRSRAAEFLGLTGAADPRPIITEVLNKSTDPIEANLILNSVVLLRDGKPGIDFDFSTVEGAAWMQEKSGIQNFVQRRMKHFRGEEQY